MAGEPAYSDRHEMGIQVAAAVAAMFAVALIIYPFPALPILASAPLILFLFLYPRFRYDEWVLVYLSMALAIYYSSIAQLTSLLIPAYAVLLLRFVGGLPHRASPASTVLGPSSASVLRAAPLFLFASLANYRVVVSVAILTASTLALALINYALLSRFKVIEVSYDREAVLGKHLAIRVTVASPRGSIALVSLGESVKSSYVAGTASIMLKLRTTSVGRFTRTLKVIAYDPWLVSGRSVAEVLITFTVIPSHSVIAKRIRKASSVLPSSLTEPMETSAFIIGHGERAKKLSRPTDIHAILRAYPRILRAAARSLIAKTLTGGGSSGTAEGGHRKGVFGEYYGVRSFAPGDSPRVIHWKKSVSLRRLVVKEFVTGEAPPTPSVRAGRFASIIVADLTSSSVKELDNLVTKLLYTLQQAAETAGTAQSLLIMLIGATALTLKGPIRDVLKRVADAFAEILPETMHEYITISGSVDESWAESLIAARGCCGLVNAVVASSLTYAKGVIDIIVRHGLPPPKTVAIIHGRPTSVRNAILSYRLKSLGYKVMKLGEGTA